MRTHVAIAIADSLGLPARIIREYSAVSILQVDRALFAIPVDSGRPVVRDCSGYQTEFAYIEDGVRSLVAI